MRKIISLIHVILAVFLTSYLLSIGVSVAYAEDQGSFRLGYTFKPGSLTKYKAELTQESEYKGMSGFRLFDMEFEEKCVEAKDDTLFKLEITFTKVSASLKRNDELKDFTIGKQMEGQTFIYNLTSKGIISDVEAKAYIEDEKEVLSTLTTFLSASYPYLPDSTVLIGAEWYFSGSNIVDTKSDEDIEYSSKFKAEKFKKEKGMRCVAISLKTETSINGRMEDDAAKFVVDGSGEGKGEYLFDIDNGIMVKFKRQSSAKITAIDATASSAAERESFDLNLVFNIKKELK